MATGLREKAMSKPFERAILTLRAEVAEQRNLGSSWRAEMESAIRVLEAAGDFTADDKERIAKALDNIPFYVPLSGYKCPGQVLRDKFKAFLSALPDKVTP